MISRKVTLFPFRPSSILFDTATAGLDDRFDFKVANSRNEAIDLCRNAEVLVMKAPMKELVESAENCKWIHVLGVGVDEYLAMERVRNDKSLLLTTSAGAFGVQVSEHVFSLILAVTRGLKPAILSQQGKRWMEAEEVDSSLREINGMTMVILGLGGIGLEVARRAKGFGLMVIGVRKSQGQLTSPDSARFVDEVVSVSELDKALPRGDIIVNTLPLTQDTKNILNSTRFSKLKRGSMFINVGRGGTVDGEDLIDAIKSGIIAYAGLDVFNEEPLPKNSPLWKFDNVVITPHWAGRSILVQARVASILRENLLRYSQGEQLKNIIDREKGY
jgi:phosphoglycerate dehydrogenase-like enzyme